MLKSIIYSVVISFVFFSCSSEEIIFSPSDLAILPKPNKVEVKKGYFTLKNNTKVSFEDDISEASAKFFVGLISNKYGTNLDISKKKQSAQINLINNSSLPKEGYRLHVETKKISIESNGEAGYFYGLQTLLQLLTPPSNASTGNEKKWVIPCVLIEDEPRFAWRAYMLDESRYFHGEKFVKLILDQMAELKMNVFHWHLTDDAGWRIEIKKYPLLTEVGSKRTDSEIGTWKSGKTSGVPHSGFYTQEQIKDIVAYAAERNITVVPEFEMPGHANSAIAAYTWLGTAGVDIDVPIKFGRLYDNYDVTKPEVLQFFKDVLTEIFELFPSEVIHVGGDEVGYKVWEDSKHVQAYMKEKGIKTPADLQINFINEISNFIEANGRRMMGWNEIMGKNIHQGFEEKKNDKEAELELAKNVVVHFWKGNLALATEAAEKGYGIVNSLHSNTYLDYSYENISLEKAYGFNPIPEGLEEKYHPNIYGLGCQMWTEWAPTNEDVAYQTFPRIAAFAEVGWTELEEKDFENFSIALKEIQLNWDKLNINYAKVLK